MTLESVLIVQGLCILVLLFVMWWAGGYSVREVLGLEDPTRPESPQARPGGGARDGKSPRSGRGQGGPDYSVQPPVPTEGEAR